MKSGEQGTAAVASYMHQIMPQRAVFAIVALLAALCGIEGEMARNLSALSGNAAPSNPPPSARCRGFLDTSDAQCAIYDVESRCVTDKRCFFAGGCPQLSQLAALLKRTGLPPSLRLVRARRT